MRYQDYNGSTNFLTHYIKAFIGVKIKNRIIAIYDNDAAACAELENLDGIMIPDNIKVIRLPDIDIAKNYPTIGPTNKNKMNINGLACSIELFLGNDILKNDSGEFEPIRWKGYIDKIGKYQGEIQNKAIIQERFKEKLQQGAVGPYDEMNTLLRRIIEIWS